MKTVFVIKNTKDEIWAMDNNGTIYRMFQSSNDLFPEDIENGIVDAIYYATYENIASVREDFEEDGGEILLTKGYEEYSVEEILQIVEEFCMTKFLRYKQEDITNK